ncbi:MAG: DUF3626 domain-containing protein [Cyclobacteriaceae bacterium]
MRLTEKQHLAIKRVSEYALKHSNNNNDLIKRILYHSNVDHNIFSTFQNNLTKHSRIALHFHPDRLTPHGFTVINGLKESGLYKNQFETNISDGSVSAFLGGDRDRWETEIFHGAYVEAQPVERPKYGALNLTLTEDGPSPRFGSCYFLLKPQVKERATFVYGDSHQLPREYGTIKEFEMIHSALLNDLFIRGTAVGQNNVRVRDFLELVNMLLASPSDLTKLREHSKNLDFYIEAQVHGEISLKNDVDYLVADFSFIGTDIADKMELLCDEYRIKLIWNSGLKLKVEDFPFDFRGATVPKFASEISENGVVTAHLIGKASKQHGNKSESLQILKYLWHCLVRFGEKMNENN